LSKGWIPSGITRRCDGGSGLWQTWQCAGAFPCVTPIAVDLPETKNALPFAVTNYRGCKWRAGRDETENSSVIVFPIEP
jgi:hypothetical protein